MLISLSRQLVHELARHPMADAHPQRPENALRCSERASLNTVHQQLGGPIVLVWDNLTHHKDTLMKRPIATRPWLTVFYLPSYAPELNPVETVWSHLKRSLGNLAACTLDELADVIRTRLRRMQYRPDLLDAFMAHTGLITNPTLP
jgi:putative transposase